MSGLFFFSFLFHPFLLCCARLLSQERGVPTGAPPAQGRDPGPAGLSIPAHTPRETHVTRYTAAGP